LPSAEEVVTWQEPVRGKTRVLGWHVQMGLGRAGWLAMVLPFNTFTLHNLVGFLVTASLAVTFYVVYAGFGRRRLDLLAANFILCAAGMCGVSFITDNLVPAGVSAYGWEGGPTAAELAKTTLEIHRLGWAFALFGMVSQLHFVLRYCRRYGWILKHIKVLYAITLVTIPLIWTPLWMHARTEPLAGTSSWVVAIPWIPVIGPPALPFTLIWYTLVIYSVVMLWRNARRPATVNSEYSGQELLVMAAFLAQMIVTMVDLVFVMIDYNGISVTPIGSMAMGIILAVALFKARLRADEEKRRLAEERTGLLETLNIRLLSAREEERRRVAKDLHDSVAQSLLSLQLRMRGNGELPDQPERFKPFLGELADQCKDVIHEVRGICHGLYPASLDLLGLAPALAKVIDYCRAAGKQGRIHHNPSMVDERYPAEVEIAVFRVCQEAVNNAVRHSGAGQVDVYLEHTGSELVLTVVDDGEGFDVNDRARHGLGMNTMRDRMTGIGGMLRIESEPGQTRIEASVPCAASLSNVEGDDQA